MANDSEENSRADFSDHEAHDPTCGRVLTSEFAGQLEALLELVWRFRDAEDSEDCNETSIPAHRHEDVFEASHLVRHVEIAWLDYGFGGRFACWLAEFGDISFVVNDGLGEDGSVVVYLLDGKLSWPPSNVDVWKAFGTFTENYLAAPPSTIGLHPALIQDPERVRALLESMEYSKEFPDIFKETWDEMCIEPLE
jgi:hypothetical protein